MKRFFTIFIAVTALAVSASAQDSYYAELLSRNNYYGTARSIALGGAMTALGGDLGSVTYNPAGSAVNDYCQFTISPGLAISTTAASYDPLGREVYEKALRTNHTKFILPNMGINLVFYPEDSNWITATSLGFIANTTNNYLSYSSAGAANSATSFLAGLASGANGLSYNDMPLALRVAYDANQFGEYGPEGSYRYVGNNELLSPDETRHYIPGQINQNAIYNTHGSKTDYIFNLGFNAGDAFYFGFNLGITSLAYFREEFFTETAVQPEQFPIIMFDNAGNLVSSNYLSSSNIYKLNSNAIGVYGRFGFIWLPSGNIRLGASIQTPTTFEVNEEWSYSAKSTYDMQDFNGSASTDPNDPPSDTYNFRAPYIFNAGIAYTAPGVGLLSLDYELMDYSIMKYSYPNTGFLSEDPWATTNYVNRTFCGVSHSVRAGVEFKPIPSLALRAGYSFISDPEKWFTDSDGNRVNAETWQGYNQILSGGGHFDSYTHAISAGLGYSSPGSFFFDMALRSTFYPQTRFAPYYYACSDAMDKDGVRLNTAAPMELLDRSVIDIVATFGWRF